MTIKCTKCGKTVSVDVKLCPHCGSALKRKSKGEKKSIPSKASSNNQPIFSGNAILSSIFLLAVIVTVLYGYRYVVPTKESQVHTHTTPMNQSAQVDPNKLNQLQQQLNQNPQGVKENIDMGNFLFDHGQFEQALLYYNKALERDDKNIDAIVDAGVCYFELKRFDLANKYFKRALEINPNHPNTLYNLGIVSAQTGDMAGMMEYWATLMRIAPESLPAQNAKRMIEQIKSNSSNQ
jgi:cytochrome c-type biogenesis protein CcmH/NrfG